MVEDAEATPASDWVAVGRFADACGSRAGSGGGRGGLGLPRRFPVDLGRSAAEGIGCDGGEYWVPASVIGFATGAVDSGRLGGLSPTVGD